MVIFTSPRPLVWGELDIPLLGLGHDCGGNILELPPLFAIVADPYQLWLIVNHRRPALLHPKARPGFFQTELWKYDVAELFLADPASQRYFEFNLAPNGAWWSCEFTAPRVRADALEIAMPEVATFSEIAVDGSWVAAMALPLDLLRARLDFGTATRANVALILESPEQRFLSANNLGAGEPDFHRPSRFSEVNLVSLPE